MERFPQLSETFIENELRVLLDGGQPVEVVSLRHPRPEAAGSTRVPPENVAYAPPPVQWLWAVVRWFARRPLAFAANVEVALRHRSRTMLRSAFDAAWVADRFAEARVRHVHAHFATEAASVAMPVARLLRLEFTFTAHALDLYLRTRGLCAKAAAAARVVTVCEYNVDQLLAACPHLDRSKIELVYCGVDPTEFALRDAPPPSDALRVLSVGRLVPKKGFDDLIEAAALLRADGVDVQCEIIGSGHIRDDLEAAIDRHGVRDAVALVSSRPHDEVRAAMVASDVFVLACVVAPDGDRDSMPVVLKEAMAVGVPVVATREVGNPEMVDDCVGRLVPPRDPRALADAIAAVGALSPEERRTLGLAGRQRVLERFDVRTETSKLAAIFATVAPD